MRRTLLMLGILAAVAPGLAMASPQAPSTSQLPNTFSIMRSLMPLYPAPQAPTDYPLGNDLWLGAAGSADVHVQTWSINLTATTSLTGGAGPQTATVGSSSKMCPSTATSSTSCITLTGTTSRLCSPTAGCTLVIDQDTANEESIAAANWSVLNATQLSITPVNSHSQPYNIRQVGAVYIDTRYIGIDSGDSTNRGVQIWDRNHNPILTVPNDTGASFPYNAFQVLAKITGNSIANGGDILFQNNSATSCTRFNNSINTARMASLCETNGAGQLQIGNTTNTSFTVQASSDTPRVYGGGTSNSGNGSIQFYTNGLGTGHAGTFAFFDNATDLNRVLNIDTSTGGFTATGSQPTYTLTSTLASGNAGPTLTFTNQANTPFKIVGNQDIPRLYGGGTSGGFLFYGSQGGTGTSGQLLVRNNATDNTNLLNLTTAGNLTLNGTVTSAATSGSQFACSGAATCSLASASGRNVTVDTGGGTATASLGAANATTTVVGTSTTTRPVQIAGGSGAFVGSCTMSAATTCTATVPSGAKCVAVTTTGAQTLKSVAVSTTTATVTATASGSDTWNILCL